MLECRYYRPKEFIDSLQVGDVAPNCFEDQAEVTKIFHRGINLDGKAFICYYTTFSPTSQISHTVVEQ